MTRALKYGRKGAARGSAQSMVVFLHGYGADGADLLDLATPLAKHLPGTVFIAPDAPEPCAASAFGRQWFPIPRIDGSSEEEMQGGLARATVALDAFLDARMTEEGVSADRVALVGFSQGTMMALHVGPRRSDVLAGIVGFSGKLLSPEQLEADTVTRPPVLLIHGDADPVVPFEEMAVAGNALVAAGFETFGHVMKGTPHGIAPDGQAVALSFLRDRLT
ncbi:alpha/beta hydrolase [Falsirhodobacter sp. alg1]|uniref:alpha/beta hydrolase n=1 Tax=Falsirhodobacter sp. alg1 TaxID=1472418 RepID=UPI0005EEC8EC|nr:dienelactone hydrolase family protein [Falsirhodobacter sp. alg1]